MQHFIIGVTKRYLYLNRVQFFVCFGTTQVVNEICYKYYREASKMCDLNLLNTASHVKQMTEKSVSDGFQQFKCFEHFYGIFLNMILISKHCKKLT